MSMEDGSIGSTSSRTRSTTTRWVVYPIQAVGSARTVISLTTAGRRPLTDRRARHERAAHPRCRPASYPMSRRAFFRRRKPTRATSRSCSDGSPTRDAVTARRHDHDRWFTSPSRRRGRRLRGPADRDRDGPDTPFGSIAVFRPTERGVRRRRGCDRRRRGERRRTATSSSGVDTSFATTPGSRGPAPARRRPRPRRRVRVP